MRDYFTYLNFHFAESSLYNTRAVIRRKIQRNSNRWRPLADMITLRPKLKSMEEDREKAGAHIETIRIQRGNKFFCYKLFLVSLLKNKCLPIYACVFLNKVLCKCVFFRKSSSANNLRFHYCIYSCMKFVFNGPNSKFLNYYVLIKLTHYKTY